MSVTDIAIILGAVGAFIATVAAAAVTIIAAVKKGQAPILEAVQKVQHQTDGLTQALIDENRITAEAVGKAKGIKQEEIRAAGVAQGTLDAATATKKLHSDE